MSTVPEIGREVRDFYARYPQLATSEVTWITRFSFEGHRVLDAGCGDGAILEAIARRGGLSLGVGLDLSPASLETAARRTDDALRFVAGSIFQVPVADRSVDDVISIGVVHYFPDAQPILQEYARVLRPGGRMFLFVYRPHPVHTLRLWMLGRSGTRALARLGPGGTEVERNLVMNTVDPPRYWPLSRRRIGRLAEACGLEVVSIEPKPTHVPQLLLRGAAGPRPAAWRTWSARAVEAVTRHDPLHLLAFGYYVVARRRPTDVTP